MDIIGDGEKLFCLGLYSISLFMKGNKIPHHIHVYIFHSAETFFQFSSYGSFIFLYSIQFRLLIFVFLFCTKYFSLESSYAL